LQMRVDDTFGLKIKFTFVLCPTKKIWWKKSFRVPLFAAGSAMTAIFCRPW
jgi:hypothetical protein